MKKAIYTSINFENNNHHMTWNFNSVDGPEFPPNVKEGDSTTIYKIGEYSDELCSCDIVQYGNYKYSPFNGNVLHITKSTNGIPAYQVGVRATENRQNIKYLDDPIPLKGTWSMFRVEDKG